MRWARIAFGLVIAVLLLGGVGLWAGKRYLDEYLVAQGPLEAEREVVLPSGTGLTGIARRLTEAGVIASPDIFLLAARLNDRDRGLQAGEYRFAPGITADAVLSQLKAGRVLQHRITVPEGLTVVDAFAIIAAAPMLDGPMPAMPPEGGLLPETWSVTRGESRTTVVERMRKAMDDQLAAAWAGRAADLPVATPEEALILASLVEKETSVALEYPKVASVFHNRLRRKMRLQSDPTAIYGITQGQRPLGRELTRADLELDNPWNTYRIDRLPKTPIANPGKAAIQAVLHPDTTDYLYFVADGSGGHAFARSLAEHNRNVARWRRIRDAGGGEGG